MEEGEKFNQSLEIPIVKLLILGDQSVGKTSLLLRYTKDHFSENRTSTLGVDFKQKAVNRGQNSFFVQIWDSAGQERFRSVTKTYYKKASGIIVAFDSSNNESFLNIRGWVQQILSEVDSSVPVVLAATKSDLGKAGVNDKEVKELCRELGFKIFFTSSKANLNVNELFDYLIDEIIKVNRMFDRSLSLTGSKGNNLAKKKKCC